jgi:DNA processing protein
VSTTWYALALTLIPGIGRKSALAILREFPTLSTLRESSDDEFRQRVRIRGLDRHTLLTQLSPALDLASAKVEQHDRASIRILSIDSAEFPEHVREVPDPPVSLYVKGSLAALHRPAVAVIGTRGPTAHGCAIAERISAFLASEGFVVVSGLAKGIDGAAHRSTVAKGGYGVAVLAEGLDKIYPAEHRPLAEQLLACGGALVSEYPLGTRAQRSSFVERDRIQSALSVAVIPVQTDLEGGTMHTVRFAETQGRPLLCPRPLPSEAGAPQNRGIRHLIDTGRAWAFDRSNYDELVDRLRQCQAPMIRQHQRGLFDPPIPGTSAEEHAATTAPPVQKGEPSKGHRPERQSRRIENIGKRFL